MDYERLERITNDLKSLLESDMALGYKEAWNAAIEAAAKITEHSEYAEQIRKLKK